MCNRNLILSVGVDGVHHAWPHRSHSMTNQPGIATLIHAWCIFVADQMYVTMYTSIFPTNTVAESSMDC